MGGGGRKSHPKILCMCIRLNIIRVTIGCIGKKPAGRLNWFILLWSLGSSEYHDGATQVHGVSPRYPPTSIVEMAAKFAPFLEIFHSCCGHQPYSVIPGRAFMQPTNMISMVNRLGIGLKKLVPPSVIILFLWRCKFHVFKRNGWMELWRWGFTTLFTQNCESQNNLRTRWVM